MTGAVSSKQYPAAQYPEFAFAGRSNVGKSSLINSLLNRKSLVKPSATPGKTQMINFFKINDDTMFADLPGYGFAKVPQAVKNRWKNMIEQYLLNRQNLVCVIMIVDIRRTPTDLDIELKRWLSACEIDSILVATKLDKLSQKERARQLRLLNDVFMEGSPEPIIAYSSKTNAGRLELWKAILKKIELRNGETETEYQRKKTDE